MLQVNFVRSELRKLKTEYATIRDCLKGEVVIKEKEDKYLPRPSNNLDTLKSNEYYNAYLQRAKFFNVTNKTVSGLTGEVFRKDYNAKLTNTLDDIIIDVTGTGLNLKQISKKCVFNTISYGRCGLLSSYPINDSIVSKEDEIKNNIKPYLTFYNSADIINWRVERIGGIDKLTLVVLKEIYPYYKNLFESEDKIRYRVLTLENGIYYQQVYYTNDNVSFENDVKYMIVDKNGNPINEILFTFIGANDNDPNPDYPPIYDIASLNIGHYINSADYEDSCHMVGQPTLVMEGLSQHWADNILKNKVNLGSKGGIPLPKDSKAYLLQVKENTMAIESMKHKEKQMASLGAKLIEPTTVYKTEVENVNAKLNETSILSNIVDNVSIGIREALYKFTYFTGEDYSEIEFNLSTEFELLKLSPEDRKQLITDYQSGLLSFNEVRDVYRKAGLATKDDELVKNDGGLTDE